MNVDDVFARATDRTGMTKIDSDSWREGLALVLEETSAPPVTDGGRSLVVGRAVDALSNRLRVHAYVQEHPEVLDDEVVRPLFIMGMPRTGTTMASYLLDQDPARRSLLKWEAFDSVPPATTETLRSDPRCLAMAEADKVALDYLIASGTGVPHWDEADGPTECMFLHEQDFKGLLWDAWTPTARYAEWLLSTDVTSAYEYQRRVLQVLQSRAPGSWTLKMPSHAVHIATLLRVFPDAQFVWAHRDPFTATASLCNLQMTPARMILDATDIDREAIGQNCTMQMREHVMRPLQVRAEIGDDRFFDLYYSALMDDPIAQMRAIYDWAGETLAPDVQQRMVSWLMHNPQHKHGVSHYSLAEYGLGVEALEPVFDEYLSAFPIELDAAA